MRDSEIYLYRVTGKYDPAIKRSRKITLKYLGRITPDGLLRPKSVRLIDELQYITNREYGTSGFMLSQCSDMLDLLKKHFPDRWKGDCCVLDNAVLPFGSDGEYDPALRVITSLRCNT